MKVEFDINEMYPVYTVYNCLDGSTDGIEVDEVTRQRWDEALRLFHAVQAEMREYHDRLQAIQEEELLWWSIIVYNNPENYNFVRYGFYGRKTAAKEYSVLLAKHSRTDPMQVEIEPARPKHIERYKIDWNHNNTGLEYPS